MRPRLHAQGVERDSPARVIRPCVKRLSYSKTSETGRCWRAPGKTLLRHLRAVDLEEGAAGQAVSATLFALCSEDNHGPRRTLPSQVTQRLGHGANTGSAGRSALQAAKVGLGLPELLRSLQKGPTVPCLGESLLFCWGNCSLPCAANELALSQADSADADLPRAMVTAGEVRSRAARLRLRGDGRHLP